MSISIPTSRLLLDESPLVVLPALAKQVGLNESIIIQQIHYWLQKSNHEHEDRLWIYNSIASWQEQFPFWSTKTIQRIIKSLKDKKLIETGNFNRLKFDKTTWYTICYNQLELLLQPEKKVMTECPVDVDNMSNTDSQSVSLIDEDIVSQPIPKTTKNTTKTTTDIVVKKSEDPLLPDWLNKEIWEEWIEHRKSIKKSLTPLAIKRQINTLEKYKDQHEELLGEAIEKGWINIVTPDKRFDKGVGTGGYSNGKENLQESYLRDLSKQGDLNTQDLLSRTTQVNSVISGKFGVEIGIFRFKDRVEWIQYTGPEYVALPIKHPRSRLDKIKVLFHIDELRQNLYVHLHGKEWSEKREKEYQKSNKTYVPAIELVEPIKEEKEEFDEVPF